MKLAITLIILPLILGFSLLGRANEEVDRLSLVAILVRDGEFERAEMQLQKIDPKEDSIDQPRYFSLKGLVDLHRKRYSQALESFHSSLQLNTQNLSLYLYLAQAYFGLKEYNKALESLHLSGPEGSKRPSTYLLKSACFWSLNDSHQAWASLSEGIQTFPHYHKFNRQKVLYLLDLGLFNEAKKMALHYLVKSRALAKEYLKLGASFRQKSQWQSALILLQTGHLLYPENYEFYVEMAQIYVHRKKILIAAELLQRAGIYNQKYNLHAAELFREGGKIHRALNLNAQVKDQKKKFKQRLAIYIQDQRFDLALSMEGALKRLGMNRDENIRYAIAFSNFKAGRFVKANAYLNEFQDPILFEKSIQLRKTMDICTERGLQCP